MTIRIEYEQPVAATATTKNHQIGTGLARGSICIPNTDAANERGIKMKASSVSRVTACASSMDLRLSSRAILDVKEAEVTRNLSVMLWISSRIVCKLNFSSGSSPRLSS